MLITYQKDTSPWILEKKTYLKKEGHVNIILL